MRVILADDAILVRQGVARLLEDAGFEVVAGWSFRGACRELEVEERRAWRWTQRRASGGDLADRRADGLHGRGEYPGAAASGCSEHGPMQAIEPAARQVPPEVRPAGAQVTSASTKRRVPARAAPTT